MMELRVWWIRQVPNEPEYYPVSNIDEAIVKLKELERLDLANPFIETNAGGLEVFEDDEWTEWHNELGEDIGEVISNKAETRA
ncbi:hypothetical protein ES703_112903 [subsurface metagenome]